MKTTSTIFIVSLALAVSLLAVEAQARGDHSGGNHSGGSRPASHPAVNHSAASHSAASHSTSGQSRSTASLGKTNFQQRNIHNAGNRGQVNNVCCEYNDSDDSCSDADQPSVPVAKIVRIVNPLETQTTLGFAVNGQAYSLDAGQTQELELTENTVIEFDRGSENATGRYTLSEGAYRFASTSQGWELYRSNDAAQSDAVAAD